MEGKFKSYLDQYSFDCYIYKNIINNNDLLIIKIIFSHFSSWKDDKDLLDEIREKIDEKIKGIHYYLNSKNFEVYIHINDCLIKYPEDYNLILNEYKTLKEKSEEIEKEKKILDDKINENNALYEEKIKKLENELNEEKNKNKKLEQNIIDLKNELNKIYELKGKQKNTSRESLLINIIEKEEEIKNLKMKLSRFPFELNEGEKLLALTFTSVDKTLHHSIICKNTDIFNIIENQLYKCYPIYKEKENYFTLNGNKINKYKTLEENNIKNNNIIIMNSIK